MNCFLALLTGDNYFNDLPQSANCLVSLIRLSRSVNVSIYIIHNKQILLSLLYHIVSEAISKRNFIYFRFSDHHRSWKFCVNSNA